MRIHFTVDDMTRIRITTTLGPVADAVFVLGMLNRTGDRGSAKWRGHVRARIQDYPVELRSTVERLWKLRAPEELLCLVDEVPGVDDSALRALNLSAHAATAGLMTLWQVAVAPYRGRILAYLEAGRDARSRMATTDGVGRLLGSLHPAITWDAPVLSVPCEPDDDVTLGGKGLQLCPSVFLRDRSAVLIGSARESGLPTLVFAAAPSRTESDRFWEEPDRGAKALGALVGKTRAAALRELTLTSTTGQLAQRLGISAAGASQHAAVLREVGLITSLRVHNTVLHTVTPLGLSLLAEVAS